MDIEKVPYNNLPDCVKTGLNLRGDLTCSMWVKKQIHLDELFDILPRLPQEDENLEVIRHYKNDYIQRREVCPPALEIIGDILWPADGFHRIVAYGLAFEEDSTLPVWIECWVRVL